MNWAVALGAVLFGAFVLSMMAPAVMRDPFTTAAAFMTGILVGMMLKSASSEDDRGCRKRH